MIYFLLLLGDLGLLDHEGAEDLVVDLVVLDGALVAAVLLLLGQVPLGQAHHAAVEAGRAHGVVQLQELAKLLIMKTAN